MRFRIGRSFILSAFCTGLLSGVTSTSPAHALFEEITEKEQQEEALRLEKQTVSNFIYMFDNTYEHSQLWLKKHNFPEDRTGPKSISNSVPEPSREWGLRARYCEGTLIIFLEHSGLKNLGEAGHNKIIAESIRTKRFYGKFEADRTVNTMGIKQSIPDCLYDSDWGQQPAALNAVVVWPISNDPKYQTVRERSKNEYRKDSCPVGQFGQGPFHTRSVTWKSNDPDNKTYTDWTQTYAGNCRVPYEETKQRAVACSFTDPRTGETVNAHNVFQQEILVNSDDESTWVYGPWAFSWGLCKDGVKTPTLPNPTKTITETPETRSVGCPSGYTGSLNQRRIITKTTVTFPWDQPPVIATEKSEWATYSGSCTRKLACYKFVSQSAHDDRTHYRNMPDTGQRNGDGWKVSSSYCGGGSANSGGSPGDGGNNPNNPDHDTADDAGGPGGGDRP